MNLMTFGTHAVTLRKTKSYLDHKLIREFNNLRGKIPQTAAEYFNCKLIIN